MRIVFYYFPTGAFNQQWIHYHYEDELRRAGHQLTTVNPFDRGRGLPRGAYDEFVVDRVAAEHRRQPISLFFASVRDHEMSPAAVARISEIGVRTANVTWDDTLMSHRVKRIAAAFDVYWVADPQAVGVMRGHGARVLDMPTAANPGFFRTEPIAESVEVSFCGQRYGSRIPYIDGLFERRLPVEVYGVGWKSAEQGGNPGGQQRRLGVLPAVEHLAASLTHAHGRTWARASLLHRLRPYRTAPKVQALVDRHAHPPLPFEEMVRLYSSSKLTLGFNELGHTHLLRRPLAVARTRDYEALASGACHLMYRVPATQEHFEEDREVLFYSSLEELADKVRFYLDPRRDSLRAEIRLRARDRVLREHTWTHRFDRILRELGLSE